MRRETSMTMSRLEKMVRTALPTAALPCLALACNSGSRKQSRINSKPRIYLVSGIKKGSNSKLSYCRKRCIVVHLGVRVCPHAIYAR